MASVEKFTQAAVVNQLRHIERTIAHPSNKDIDSSIFAENYSLIPQREMTSYQYFKKRKSELYCYNRADVKVMAGWIITAPKDLDKSLYKDFFNASYDFLCDRYQEKNCVQAIVHHDESGQPHLHFCFIPTTSDKKHGGEKICAHDVLTKTDLKKFHPELQKYLNARGIEARVYTGITSKNGGNRTVQELKEERTISRWQTQEIQKVGDTKWNY